jgi:hypothetical protein
MSENLDDAETALKDMYLRGQLTIEAFSHGMIQIAAGWVEAGNKQAARDVISQLTEGYLTEVLPRQMQDDAEFQKTAVSLARGLADEPPSDDTEADIDLAILRGPAAKA